MNKQPKQQPGESAWKYTSRVFSHCGDGARNFICDRLEVEQLSKLKRYPVSAILGLERQIKEDGNSLIQRFAGPGEVAQHEAYRAKYPEHFA